MQGYAVSGNGGKEQAVATTVLHVTQTRMQSSAILLSMFELHGRPFMPKGSTPKARPKRASSKPAVKRNAEVATPKGAAKKLKK